MRGAWTIARKDLACLFYSPIAYMLLFLVSVWTGYWFYNDVSQFQGYVAPLPARVFGLDGSGFFVIVIFLTAPITMRLLSEEKRSGTIEPLMTAPVSDLAVALGKYLAAALFFALLWLPALGALALVWSLGGRFDTGLLAASAAGAFLMGGLFLALGLFASSVAANQIVACSLGLLLNFAFLFGPYLVGSNVRDPEWRGFFQRINVTAMLGDSTEVGILDSSYVVFFLSLTALFLFFTVRAVEARKWR